MKVLRRTEDIYHNMRCGDLLQVLLLRFVDPQKEEQDWTLLAALFYSLTRLLLSPQRLEQLYYKYLQSYCSRAAMEVACKQYELQLFAKLQQNFSAGNSSAVVRMKSHSLDMGFSQPLQGASVLPLHLAATLTSFSGADVASGTVPAGPLSNRVASFSVGGDNLRDAPTVNARDAWHHFTAEQRERWQSLRQEPISPDILTALLQRFTLVGDAAVFMAPVHPSTIMEFNGVQSDPYMTVVRRPLSLMDIKRLILASRREYEFRRRQTLGSSSPGSSGDHGVATRKRGRASLTAAVSGSESKNLRIRGGDSDTGIIRTLQELERAVWHIAANCVVFNAPESYYPQTARRFAAACSDIIEEYCMQRVLSA